MHFAENLREEAADALAFLKNNTMAAVATASRDCRPQVAFVYYVVDEDFNFFFITRRDSRKFFNMKDTGRACVAVGNEDDVATVQMDGPAEEVVEPGEISRHTHMIIRSPKLASLYMRAAPMKFLPPRVPEPDGTHFALMRVRPDWIRWMRKDRESDEPQYFTLLGEK